MKWRKVLPYLWLIVLSVYILAGTPQTPFHGDESTTLWMSRDYGYIFLDGELDRVRYEGPPLRSTEQHMRLITGSLTKYAMGLSWQANGYTTETINEQWDWGADWAYNQSTGHAPDDTLLMLGRWPSAMLLAAGVWLMFWIARMVGGVPAAYLASLYYALNPALLLNGRRAMFEGGLIFFSLLTLLAAIYFLRKRSWLAVIILSIAVGLSGAAKHTAILTVFALILAAGWILLKRYLHQQRQIRHEILQMVTQLSIIGIIAFMIFYLLNPVWWGNPLVRAGQVLEARQNILDGQVAAFGGYTGRMDQFAGFLRQTFIVAPQYYEVDGWGDYIGDQIHRYEKSGLQGIPLGGSLVGGLIVAGLAAVGLIQLVRGEKSAAVMMFLSWVVVVWLTAWLLTPIEWQRYYLMVYPGMAMLLALGLLVVVESAFRKLKTTVQ